MEKILRERKIVWDKEDKSWMEAVAVVVFIANLFLFLSFFWNKGFVVGLLINLFVLVGVILGVNAKEKCIMKNKKVLEEIKK